MKNNKKKGIQLNVYKHTHSNHKGHEHEKKRKNHRFCDKMMVFSKQKHNVDFEINRNVMTTKMLTLNEQTIIWMTN